MPLPPIGADGRRLQSVRAGLSPSGWVEYRDKAESTARLRPEGLGAARTFEVTQRLPGATEGQAAGDRRRRCGLLRTFRLRGFRMFPAMTRKPVEYPSILYPAARRGGMDGPNGSACLLQESSAACPRPGTPAAAWGARRRHTGVSVQMRHVDPGTVDVFEEMLPAAVDRRVPTCQCQSGEASIMCRSASAPRQSMSSMAAAAAGSVWAVSLTR